MPVGSMRPVRVVVGVSALWLASFAACSKSRSFGDGSDTAAGAGNTDSSGAGMHQGPDGGGEGGSLTSSNAGGGGETGGAETEPAAGAGGFVNGCGDGPPCKKNFGCDPTSQKCTDICDLDFAGNAERCCSSDDCGDDTYCVNRACVPKQTEGAVCADDAECAAGNCKGRCCPAGAACDCPQPSAGNVLKNPGFDEDLSDWTIDAGPGSVSFLTFGADEDVTACHYSGHARITSNSAPSRRITQCAPVEGGTAYNFGVAMYNGSAAGDMCEYGNCDLDWFTGQGCSGESVVGEEGAIEHSWVNVGWSAAYVTEHTAPAKATSARVSCYIGKLFDESPSCSFNIDQMSLTKSPALY